MRIQKKAFVAAITKKELGVSLGLTLPDQHRPPAGSAIRSIICVERFSSLRRLIKVVSLVWRAAKKFLRNKAPRALKWEAVPSSGVVTVRERENAFRDLCLAAQEGETFQSTTMDRLVVFRDGASGLLLCGGRIQYFKEDHAAVPLLPFRSWIGTLLAHLSH